MPTSEYGNSGVTFDIIEHIGVIATYTTGWRKEINFVSWNGAPAKYDIRDWAPSYTSMSKGITFKENEMRLLLDLMRRRRRPGYSPQRGPGLRQEIQEELNVAEPEPVKAEPEVVPWEGIPAEEVNGETVQIQTECDVNALDGEVAEEVETTEDSAQAEGSQDDWE